MKARCRAHGQGSICSLEARGVLKTPTSLVLFELRGKPNAFFEQVTMTLFNLQQISCPKYRLQGSFGWKFEIVRNTGVEYLKHDMEVRDQNLNPLTLEIF